MLGEALQHVPLARPAGRGSTTSEKMLWIDTATIASQQQPAVLAAGRQQVGDQDVDDGR